MSPLFVRGLMLASSSLIPFVVSEAQAQTALPEIVVESQRSAPPRPRSTLLLPLLRRRSPTATPLLLPRTRNSTLRATICRRGSAPAPST